MADKPTINTIAAGAQYNATELNTNFNALRDEFANVLGTNGVDGSDNTIAGDIDMDGERIRNLPSPNVTTDAATKGYADSLLSGTTDTGSAQLRVDLADTANGDGASLVGIEDTRSNYTGTDVEDALQEVVLLKGTGGVYPITGDLEFTGTGTVAGLLFNDTTPSPDTQAIVNMVSEVFQVQTSYQGAAVDTPLSIDIATGTLQSDGNRVLTTDDLAPAEIIGDGTAGRVLRKSYLRLEDGTNANTLKVTVADVWNGDAIAVTDNVGKGATTGSFTLAADGVTMTFPTTGNLIAVISTSIRVNVGSTVVMPYGFVNSTNFGLTLQKLGTASPEGVLGSDLTAIVDVGEVWLDITYLTSA